MKRFFAIAVLACVAVAGFQPLPARAFTDSVLIKNQTNKCAWITMYFATLITPWDIFNHLPEGKPQFLRPGHEHLFGMGAASEMKIRAEVKANADCSGPTIADTYDIRKDNSKTYMHYQAVLMNNDRGGYNLWFK